MRTASAASSLLARLLSLRHVGPHMQGKTLQRHDDGTPNTANVKQEALLPGNARWRQDTDWNCGGSFELGAGQPLPSVRWLASGDSLGDSASSPDLGGTG